MVEIEKQLMLISGLAFLRPLLQDSGFDTSEGLVLLFDTHKNAQYFLNECVRNVNAVEVGSLKKGVSVENYEAAFHILRCSADADLLVDFFHNKAFYPVLLSGGQIPTYLDEPIVIRIFSAPFDKVMRSFSRKFEMFAKYVAKNADTVVKKLKSLHVSKYLKHAAVENEEKRILQTFLAVGFVWNDFMSSITLPLAFFDDFARQCLSMVKKSRDFFDHVDLEEEMSEVIFQYLEHHPEVKIFHANEVTQAGLNAIEVSEAILFDDDFYYIPERLVKRICAPLLATKSVGVLKEELAKEGIIVCNLDGYTVKKKYWTVDGNSNRMRAIKFVKDMLITREGLALEELVFNKEEEEVSCILEK